MSLLEGLATVFFNIFGITQPSAGALRRATLFLLAMLLLVAITVCTGGYLLYHLIRVG